MEAETDVVSKGIFYSIVQVGIDIQILVISMLSSWIAQVTMMTDSDDDNDNINTK